MREYYENAIRDLRERARLTRWSRGMPIKDIICNTGKCLVMCNILTPFSFKCGSCETENEIPANEHMHCTGCGDLIEVSLNYYEYRSQLRHQEESLLAQAHAERLMMGPDWP